ncbi:MAG: hypothetical protein QOE53_3226, partial [Pseudonocardiales bacterium]|nr:hypothetical protein [Pseudonocardiales bacterium]
HTSACIEPPLAVLRVVNELPHEQVTSVTAYSGWMASFTMVPFYGAAFAAPVMAAGSPWGGTPGHSLLE